MQLQQKLRTLGPKIGVIFLSVISLLGNSETSPSVNFNLVKDLIISKDLKSISDLLPLLPESYRSRYVLMFRSRSLHESSHRDPRVILYGEDAKFIMTFNGNPEQRAYQQLETLEFDSNTKEFLYREVTFPENQKSTEKVTFSEPNPPKCLACHQTPAHPIWDTYPLWPGAFGEKAHFLPTAEEREGMKSFLENQKNHPRYRYLVGVEKLADPSTFVSKATYSGPFRNSPNAELGAFLSEMNFQAIAKEVKHSPKFPYYQYVLLAALTSDCEAIESFLPAQVRSEYSKNYTQFATESDQLNLVQEKMKQSRAYPPHGPQSGNENLFLSTKRSGEPAVRFRYIVEMGLGLSTKNWTTALEKSTYDFTTPSLSIKDLEPYLFEEVAAGDSKFRDLHSLRSSSGQYCSYLKQKSLAALTVGQMTWVQPEISRPNAISRCIACHQTGVAPLIPFNQPGELAKWLHSKTYKRGLLIDEILFRLSPDAGAYHMPLGTNLPDSERIELENYFKNL